MTWVYFQGSGNLLKGEEVAAIGYSGNGRGLNNSAFQGIRDIGPIPQGTWLIGAKFDSQTHGRYCLRLHPSADTTTFGRSGFLIHGDNKQGNQSASHGCIILPYQAREMIWCSNDHVLTVVA